MKKVTDSNGNIVLMPANDSPSSSSPPSANAPGIHYNANMNPKYQVSEDGKTITYADSEGSLYGGSVVTLNDQGQVTGSTSDKRMRKNDDYSIQAEASKSKDACQTSDTISGDFSCNSTQQVVQGAQVGNIIGQTVGSIATQVAGQQAQMSAMTSGSMGAVYQGAAQTAQISAEKDAALGLANLAMGAWQMMKASDHKKNAQDIKAGTMGGRSELNVNVLDATVTHKSGDVAIQAKSDSTIAKETVKNFHLNNVGEVYTDAKSGDQKLLGDRAAEYKDKANEMGTKLRDIGFTAVKEQEGMQNAAQTGGMQSLIYGSQQTLNAAFGMMTANQMQKAAQQMNQAQALANRVVMPGVDPNATGATTGSSVSITGNGTGNGQAAAATDGSGTSGNPGNNLPNLGQGFNPGGPPLAVNPGPSPGVFTQAAPNQGGPMDPGVAGVTGDASTATATPSQGDQAPKLADLRGGGNYDSRGSGYAAAGMGGGGGGDKGPDISGMLGALLKGGKEDPAANNNGILEYGNRAPAGNMPVSLLDSSVNIFNRIHDQYQFQQRKW